MRNYAIDIETTATVKGAGIWEIGACTDATTFTRLCKLEPDAIIDPNTIDWLRDNELHDRYLSAQKHGISLFQALTELSEFIGGPLARQDNLITWGDFDDPLLTYWYKHLKIDVPWHYGSVLNMRGVSKILGQVVRADGTPHFHKLELRPDTSSHVAIQDAQEVLRLHANLSENLRNAFNF